MPEDLPTPEKSIKQVERDQLKRLKNKKNKLMLDEWNYVNIEFDRKN